MKKHLHKGLAWVLTLCMVLTLLPATALAAGGDDGLNISGGTAGVDYSLSEGVVSILTDAAIIVSGDTSTERIEVGADVTANLTFNRVNITAEGSASPVSVAENAMLNLTLVGENTLTGGSAALSLLENAALIIGGAGSLTATGSGLAIGGDNLASITIGGSAVVNALAASSYDDGIGIGGKLPEERTRVITIQGDAVVGAWSEYNGNAPEAYRFGGGSIIGGGDNSGSTIIIRDNAVVKRASVIGSSTTSMGAECYDGGTIRILDNASVYDEANSIYPAAGHIGGTSHDYYYGENGGAGGTITIDTAGIVYADTIGGGTGANGGAGGTITIASGTVYTGHIGGGDGIASSNGIGGAGGTITISGGTVGGGGTPTGSMEKKVGYGADARYYSAAGIGGGGGTLKGGAGGAITISGGMVYANAGATVYDPVTGDTTTSGTGIGGAAIGGGNGASGGAINISGGTVVTGVGVMPYQASSASALPAFIGGGSDGGAGQITISGGVVKVGVHPHNAPVYGNDATTIGQGKGASEAGGFVKITGGNFTTSREANDHVAEPRPWPTAGDGSTELYPASLDFYSAAGMPPNLEINSDNGGEVVYLKITDNTTKQVYPYGIKDIGLPNYYSGYIWLPADKSNPNATSYAVDVKVKQGDTVYSFEGTFSYSLNSNNVGGLISDSALIYGGEVIETLELTSDWGPGVKTYDGNNRKPNFTVKNSNNDILAEDADYTLTITYSPNDGIGNPVTVTEIKNAGSYVVTANGEAGTDYADMTATLTGIHINPKVITATGATPTAFTKQYDGNTDLYDGAAKLDELALTVNPGDLCAGDLLTDIKAPYPRYTASGVGSSIPLTSNGVTYKLGGAADTYHNYHVLLPDLTGAITVKVLGETNFDATGVTVSKTYDGTANNIELNQIAGIVTLKDLVGEEVATVNITAVSDFDSTAAGNDKTVTLTIGDLTGTNAGNYQLADGQDTITITAKILPADYTYSLTQQQQAQEFTQGGGLSQISLPETAAGVGSETVTGTVTLWHDAACTANQATNASVNELTIGQHSLYVKFVPNSSETNYTNKITTGKVVVLTVVAGAPQEISFPNSNAEVTKTYGEEAFTNAATNNSEGGGDVTYSSSTETVATVAANGQVTIIGAGTATITATAAAVEGKYRETTASYTLTVSKKDITVAADDASRKFGEENPAFALKSDSLTGLVSGDDASDLGVTLSTVATQYSNVGAYDITGTSTSANYNVTVTKGTLTISKANAPVVANITRSLLYSAAHTDVSVAIAGLPDNRGETSFLVGEVTDTNSILEDAVTATSSGIKFSTKVGEENQTATIPVTVTMQNYEDATVTVTVKLVNKTPVTITGVSVESRAYNGQAISYSGTAAGAYGDSESYDGEFEYIWSTNDGSAPKNAGSYTLIVKISDESETYIGQTEPIAFTISPKALTVKPKNISIYNGAALPTAFELEYAGIVAGDTITPSGASPAFALKSGDAALENSNTNGTYTIEWTNKDAVTLSNSNYTITKADGTLTISSRPSDGGGGGGTATPSTPPISTENGVSTVKVDAEIKASGSIVTATVTDNSMKAALEAAQKAADSSNTSPAVEIQAEAPKGATEISFSLSKSALTLVADSEAASLTMTSDLGTLNLSAGTVASIAQQASGSTVEMVLSQVNTDTQLSERQRQAVGDAPVYDISILSGGSRISSFGGGSVTVTLPYTLKAGEDASRVVIWYLDELGNIQKVSSTYNAATGLITFSTDHLSLYVVGYQAIVFTDVADDAWYAQAVYFIAEKGITTGTGDDRFSPNATLTRGQFITMLMRAYGISADENPNDNFSDAGSTYYTGYLAAAKRLGISGGVGDNKFAPEQAITRQEMFTMLYNALKIIDKLPTGGSGKSLSDFTDSDAIAVWAQEAMTALVKSDTVAGSHGKLDPTATTTRAQMAQVLYNLLSK